MTTLKRSVRTSAAALTGVLLLAGCGAAAAGQSSESDLRTVSIAIGDPVSPLVPGSTVEEFGTQVLER